MPLSTDTAVSVESLLLQVAPDAMLVVDRSGQILQANILAERLFGYPPGVLAGQPLDLLIPARLQDPHHRHLVDHVRDPHHRPMEISPTLWGLRRDGSEFAAQISLNLLPAPAEPHVLAVIRDASEYRRMQQAMEQVTTELEQQVAARDAELSLAIAERAQAEAALRETEALYQQLVENQPDLICRYLPDTTLTFVNAAYARFFGCQPGDLVGKRFIEFLRAEDRGGVWAHLAAFTPTTPEGQYEHQTTSANGSARWHLWHDFAFFDEQGKAVFFQCIGIDTTERRQAEEALRESKKRLTLALHAAHAGVWEWNVATNQAIWSEENYRVLGLKPGSVAASYDAWLRCVHPDDRVETERQVARAMEQGSDLHIEFRIVWPNGDIRWVKGVGKMQYDSTGQPIGMHGIQMDITERKQAEEALIHESQFRRAIIDRAAEGLCVCHNIPEFPQVRFTVWNPRMEEITGYTLEEINQRGWYQALYPDPEVQARARARMALMRQGEDLLGEEWEILRATGEKRLVSISTSVMETTADATHVLALIHDVTERKQVEQALFEAKERAQVTLHSIGDAVITTDVRNCVDYLNPVAEALTGWTQVEAQGWPLSEVFRIVNEQSRQPAPDPVARCLQEGKIVGLANHSILISRHGQEYHINDSAAPIRGRDGQVLGAVLVFHDVTENRQLARQLEYDATHDALTGLINRAEFERRLARALASAQQYGARHALCYLDLDQFKIVNDTAGHAAGDELLRQINTILSGMFRERDTLARIGGDEFGLLLDNCPLDRAQFIAQTVVGNIRDHRFHWEGRTYQIGVSIGLAPITAEAQDTTQLLTQADVACYIAKEMGRNRVHIYQREDTETVQRHGEILGAAGLRDSLEQGRFRLHYQPIVALSEPIPRPTRYEVLLRVAYKSSMDANTELVLPAAFIPAAERYGLMGAIDRWVIQAAFREYANGIGQTGAKIAINLSGNSLSDETLLGFIEAQFVECDFPPEQVCFEITETAAIQNLRRALELMAALKHHGSQFALDDFGSGLSSFRYLKTLPVDYLKIDGSFVKDMIGNPNDCALVAAINQMSHTLGIQTIAEYAESLTIAERLRELGVDYAQGFFFGHAAPWGQLP